MCLSGFHARKTFRVLSNNVVMRTRRNSRIPCYSLYAATRRLIVTRLYMLRRRGSSMAFHGVCVAARASLADTEKTSSYRR